VIFSRGNPPQQIRFGNSNIGSIIDGEMTGMDFDEDYDQKVSPTLLPETDEEFGDDLIPEDTEENPDDEP